MPNVDWFRWFLGHRKTFSLISAIVFIWVSLWALNPTMSNTTLPTPAKNDVGISNIHVSSEKAFSPNGALLITALKSFALGNNLQVSWVTDQLADSRLAYGNSPAVPKQQINPIATASHYMYIFSTTPGAAYYFRAASCAVANICATGPLSVALECSGGNLLSCYDWNANKTYETSECNSLSAAAYFNGQVELSRACSGGTGAPEVVSCTDSDNGITQNQQGTVTLTYSDGQSAQYSDSCSSSTQLVEMYCSGKQRASQGIICAGSCVNGACIGATGGSVCTPQNPSLSLSPSQSAPTPNTTAASYNYSIRNNDSAACPATTFHLSYGPPPASWLWHFTFSPLSISVAPGTTGNGSFTITTPTGAQNGSWGFTISTYDESNPNHAGQTSGVQVIGSAATTPGTASCTDSDNGANFETSGTVTTTSSGGAQSTYTDTCETTSTLREYTCSGTSQTSQTTTCPYGCGSGACQAGSSSSSGAAAGHTTISYNQFSDSQITAEEVTIPSNGNNIHSWICHPSDTSARRPGLVVFHGGVNRTTPSGSDNCKKMARAGGVGLDFDYPGEGGSGGSSGATSLWKNDIVAGVDAISYLKNLSYVDGGNIAFISYSRGFANNFLTIKRGIAGVRVMAATAGPIDITRVYNWHQQNATLSRISSFMNALNQSWGCSSPTGPASTCPTTMQNLSALQNISLINVPVYLACGVSDGIIPVQLCRDFKTAVLNAGKTIEYREYQDLTHIYNPNADPTTVAQNTEDMERKMFTFINSKLQ